MAKRKENESIRPILEAWEPPDEVGEAIGCVATTFTFDPGFFEEHCLSRFLRLETDPREDGAAYLIEREEKLAIASVSVLVDRSNMDGSASPRWTVLPVTVPQGIFHPKISVLAWHNCIRVIIGSANLTEPAYRKNQEIFGVLDCWENGDVPVTVLVETLAFLEQLLTLATGSDISPSPKSRARSFVAQLRTKVTGWTTASQKRTDWPKVVPIFLGPFDQLSEAIPQRLGRAQWKESQLAALELGLQLYSMEVRSANDFESAFKEATKAASAAIAVTGSPFNNSYQKRIAELATKNRLPAIYTRKDYVESGGLMSYGTDLAEAYRRVASMVDKILKGAKPADIPVEQPTKFEFVVNLKAAKQIGLTIPPNVLVRADKVIR